MIRLHSIHLLLLVCIFSSVCSSQTSEIVVVSKNGVRVDLSSSNQNELRIICYRPPQSILDYQIFKEVHVDLSITVNQYYVGNSETQVRNLHREASSKFWPNLFRTLAFFPYAGLVTDGATHSIKLTGALENSETCTGFESANAVSVTLRVDQWSASYCFLFATAVLLFVYADRLARSAIAYYSVGSSVGVVAGLLLVIFVTTRFISARKLAIVATVSTFFGSLFARLSAFNLREAFIDFLTDPDNLPYVVGYAVLSAAAAFAVLFYFGPPKSSRAFAFLSKSIQILALVLIYISVQHSKVGALLVSSLIVLHIAEKLIPWLSDVVRGVGKPFRFLRSLFLGARRKQKPRLLTNEEYRKQTELYTKQSLEDLRNYCRSSNCASWGLMRRLHNPSRFASFIEGGSCHLTDEERSLHDSLESNADVISDVSEDDSVDSNSNVDPDDLLETPSRLDSQADEDCQECYQLKNANESVADSSKLLSRKYAASRELSGFESDFERRKSGLWSPPVTKINSTMPLRNGKGLSPMVVNNENAANVRYVRRRIGLRLSESNRVTAVPYGQRPPTTLDDIVSLVGDAVEHTRSIFGRRNRKDD